MKVILAVLITILIPGTLFFFLPFLLIWLGYFNLFTLPALQYLAWIAWFAGGVLAVWTISDFWMKGRGTPAPNAPPHELVVSGPYRFTRNPMYLGALLILLGYVFWAQTWVQLVYFMLAWIGLHVMLIYFEEPNLRKRYGAAYEAYCRHTPRWLLRMKSSAK